MRHNLLLDLLCVRVKSQTTVLGLSQVVKCFDGSRMTVGSQQTSVEFRIPLKIRRHKPSLPLDL